MHRAKRNGPLLIVPPNPDLEVDRPSHSHGASRVSVGRIKIDPLPESFLLERLAIGKSIPGQNNSLYRDPEDPLPQDQKLLLE